MADNDKRTERYARLVQKQTGKAVRPYREDGYVNVLTRYGTESDSTEHYEYIPETIVPDIEMERFYEGNGLFAKIIDTPAEEAIKHGFELADLTDKDIKTFYIDALDELNWEETAATAMKWTRLFGGAVIVLIVDDGRGLEEPLDWKNLKSIDDIKVYDRSVVIPDYQSMFHYDPKEPFGSRGSRLGMPESYKVVDKYGTFNVHDSRCLVFRNGVLPHHASNMNYQLWGIPEYIRIQRAIRDSEVAHGSAVKLLDRSVQAIYKMKDLAMELATEDGEERVLRRLQTIDMARGLLNSITIDSEGEDYDFKSFSFSGVSDVISTTCNYLSALTSIPQTILFGRSPAGMNATGDSDLENYYNYVERIQKRILKKNLRYLLNVIFRAGVNSGEIEEMPDVKIEFNPLWSMSDTEKTALDQQKAQVELTKAQIASTYVQMEVIDPMEVRKKLAEEDAFDIETILDDYTEEELMENAPQQQAQGDPMGGMGGMPMGGMPGMPEAPQGGMDMGALMGGEPQSNPMMGEPKNENIGAEKQGAETMEKTPVQNDAPLKKNTSPKAEKQVRTEDIDEKVKAIKEKQEAAKKAQKKAVTTDSMDDNEGKSVGVICVRDGKVLCGRRHNTSHYGKLCGPGGMIDNGETAEEAAIREAQEEFGITPKQLMLIGRGEEEDDGNRPYVYLCMNWSGEPKSVDTEMVNPKFLSVGEIRNENDLFRPFEASIDLLEETLDGCGESIKGNKIPIYESKENPFR